MRGNYDAACASRPMYTAGQEGECHGLFAPRDG